MGQTPATRGHLNLVSLALSSLAQVMGICLAQSGLSLRLGWDLLLLNVGRGQPKVEPRQLGVKFPKWGGTWRNPVFWDLGESKEWRMDSWRPRFQLSTPDT